MFFFCLINRNPLNCDLLTTVRCLKWFPGFNLRRWTVSNLLKCVLRRNVHRTLFTLTAWWRRVSRVERFVQELYRDYQHLRFVRKKESYLQQHDCRWYEKRFLIHATVVSRRGHILDNATMRGVEGVACVVKWTLTRITFILRDNVVERLAMDSIWFVNGQFVHMIGSKLF